MGPDEPSLFSSLLFDGDVLEVLVELFLGVLLEL
jgi:hypothetical protein